MQIIGVCSYFCRTRFKSYEQVHAVTMKLKEKTLSNLREFRCYIDMILIVGKASYRTLTAQNIGHERR